MAEVFIRKAEKEDAVMIWQLILELAEFEKLRSKVYGSLKQLQEKLFKENSSVESILCIDQSTEQPTTVGFALFFTNFSTFEANYGFFLEDLYVKPAHRNQGHGKAMIRWLAKEAHRRGFPRVQWMVLDWNQNAIDFYENLGAKIMPDWRLVQLDTQAIAKLSSS